MGTSARWRIYTATLDAIEPIGNIPPAEAEARYHALMNDRPLAA